MNEGVIVAVGKGALNKEGKHIPLQVNAGDKVLLPPYGGSPVKVAGEVCSSRYYNGDMEPLT